MIKKFNCFLLAGLFFAAPVFLCAQTASELDAVLASPAVTYAQAARFVLASAGSADSSFELPAGTQSGDPITMGYLSFLLMKAFDIKGGLMYSLLPGPRYAYRTMVSRSFIQGASDPAMTVSGERFLLILTKVIAAEGGNL